MAVGRERISTPRPRSHSTVPPGQGFSHPPWAQAHPTDPASQRLSSNQPGPDSHWMSGCPVLTRHPQGWSSAFSPQAHEKAGAETGTELRGSHKHLCATLWADNSSSAKDSGCCKQASKESSILWHMGILSLLGSTGQKHAHSSRGSTPSHSMQPELLGLLGTYLCLNIYIICMYV